MRPALALAFLGAIAGALDGCGFHFAGSEPLAEPLKSVYIDLVDPYHVAVPPLETSLQARLVRSGGVIKSTAADAQSVLRLSDLQETQEVLSIGPDGKAIEYRLVSRVTYELRNHDRILIPQQSQGLDRAYSFSATQILPKEAEEARLSAFVQDDLAEVILLRIQAQLRKHPEGVPIENSQQGEATPGNSGATGPAAAPTALPKDLGGAAPAP